MLIRNIVDQGGRDHMEDRWSVNVKDGWTLICVADGHGGEAVAAHAIEAVPAALGAPRVLRSFSNRLSHDFATELFDVYVKSDEAILQRFDPHVGCTLCTVAVSDVDIVAANCGDTMAIVGNANGARSLSQEHKASSEVAAIEARGGRVFAPDGMMRVNGALNLSRAMGDGYLKRYITCSPFVTRCSRRDFDYVFVATDGVWDVMTPRDVHVIVWSMLFGADRRAKFRDEHSAVLAAILQACRARRSTDNIAMVLCMLPRPPSASKKNSRIL